MAAVSTHLMGECGQSSPCGQLRSACSNRRSSSRCSSRSRCNSHSRSSNRFSLSRMARASSSRTHSWAAGRIRCRTGGAIGRMVRRRREAALAAALAPDVGDVWRQGTQPASPGISGGLGTGAPASVDNAFASGVGGVLNSQVNGHRRRAAQLQCFAAAMPTRSCRRRHPSRRFRTHFIINNLATANIDGKVAELKSFPKRSTLWLGNYLVVKRVSTQPNFHQMVSTVQKLDFPAVEDSCLKFRCKTCVSCCV